MHFDNSNILRVHRQSFGRSYSPTMYCPLVTARMGTHTCGQDDSGDLSDRGYLYRAQGLELVCPKFEGQTAGVDPQILDLNVDVDV